MHSVGEMKEPQGNCSLQAQYQSIFAGLGGGAARVVLPKGQPPPAEGGSAEPGNAEAAEEPTSSGEKRKAEAEARVASTKRRPSPELQVAVLLLNCLN